MKKAISLVMILICVFSLIPVHADTAFSLRNGIQFGEDSETVASKESWDKVDGIHIFSYTGELLGMPSIVRYNFGDAIKMLAEDTDGEDSLKSVLYCINTTYTEEGKTYYSRNSVFSFVSNALKIKYGEPLTDAESIRKAGADPLVQYYVLWLTSVLAEGGTDFQSISNQSSRAVWIVHDGNRNITIELMEYRMVQDGQECYFTLLNYSAYTDAEMKAMQKGLSEKISDL